VIAEAVREAQDPLAGRDARQHILDEAGGGLGHAPAAAARTEAAPFARERHEPFDCAHVASKTGEAVRQHTAREEFAELSFHELR